VFLPTSPMPMTGYTMFVDIELVVPLSITIDEAVRIVMTGGVLIPPQERVARVVEPSPPAAGAPVVSAPAAPLPGTRQERA
jgi:uncharacterized membrane protein